MPGNLAYLASILLRSQVTNVAPRPDWKKLAKRQVAQSPNAAGSRRMLSLSRVIVPTRTTS